jgi:hypothetical protein
MFSKPFLVTHIKDPTQEGIANSEHILAVPDEKAPNGIRYQTLIGVLWTSEKRRSPAVSYHDPADLKWIGLFPEESPYHVFYQTEDDEDEEIDTEREVPVADATQ